MTRGGWLIGGLLGLAVGMVLVPGDVLLSSDSLDYLSAAKSFAEGDGFVINRQGISAKLSHYPPGYPFVVALLIRADLPLRMLNLSCIAFTAAALWYLLASAVRSLPIRVTLLLAFLLFPSIVQVHSFAWSEPLFLTLTALFLLVLEQHLRTPSSGWYLVAAAIAAAAVLTRYMGVILVAGAVVAAFTSVRPLAARVLRSGVAAAIALSPTVIWLATRHGSVGNRKLDVDPLGFIVITAQLLKSVGDAFAMWAPSPFQWFIGIVAVGLFNVAWFMRAVWASRLSVACLGLTFSYVAFVFASRVLFDQWVHFYMRMLAPIALLLLVPAAQLLGAANERWPRIVRVAGAVWLIYALGAAVQTRLLITGIGL